ncbi:hypothetical protein BDN72DRAFT_68917 [Pluteus cervinus]|uniref:Uncharacterized protein n=1 Tax=Pluteus cervinus TaxID=181527 RepID=A0ACD3AQ62_9AGAR|nr:hypothetical protein BDN72DRAFT_68917 [Pluteus cervinus]
MASPTPHKRHRRARLTRSNSSLLGTIKTLVTAPLSWFSTADGLDDQNTAGNKRRRHVPMDTQPDSIRDDVPFMRNKRIRVDSPDSAHPPLLRGSSSYLDPPNVLFQQGERDSPRPTFPSPATNDVAIPNYSGAPRNGRLSNSPFLAALSLRDTSRESSLHTARPHEANLTLLRDRSLPPLSTHPPFRLRASLPPTTRETRELSEPPALSSLVSNPIFVRAPSSPNYAPHEPGFRPRTLGSLADAHRSSKSPSRTHSSLLFGTSPVENVVSPTTSQSAAERALHGLDIYKTPLLPSHLRSASAKPSTAFPSNGPDLFQSRRKAKLVLMQDSERVDSTTPKRKKKRASENKPYAGQGGIRKLLTKRQLEDGGDSEATTEAVNSSTSNGNAVTQTEEVEQAHYRRSIGRDDEINASNVNASSLRIGRVKTRTSIPRPRSRPMRLKFSAAFDEDETIDEDMLSENRHRVMEDDPMFKPPEGFTFAKEPASVLPNITTSKEPPIASLPFSLTKRAPGVIRGQEEQIVALDTITTPQLSVGSTAGVSQPMDIQKASSVDSQSQVENAPIVPNFFASSAAFSKPLTFVIPPLSLSNAQGSEAKSVESGQGVSDRIRAPITVGSSFPLVADPPEGLILAQVREGVESSVFDIQSEPSATSHPSTDLHQTPRSDVPVALDPIRRVDALSDLPHASAAVLMTAPEISREPAKSIHLFPGEQGPEPAIPSMSSSVDPVVSVTKLGAPPLLHSTSESSSNTAFSPKPAFFGFTSSNATERPFSFESSQRPVTPPKSLDQEFRMDESPTRDMQVNGESKLVELRPSFGFSFAPLASRASPNSFTFGVSPVTLDEKRDSESKPFTFGQMSAPPSSAFAFGKTPTEEESPTTRSNTFSSNPFPGVSQATPSFVPSSPSPAPNSPSFNPAPFSFDQTSNPFTFGATQPASPSTAATPNPFTSASSVSATTPASTTLFTIGAAPSAAGARPTRKLPTRRAGAKR